MHEIINGLSSNQLSTLNNNYLSTNYFNKINSKLKINVKYVSALVLSKLNLKIYLMNYSPIEMMSHTPNTCYILKQ